MLQKSCWKYNNFTNRWARWVYRQVHWIFTADDDCSDPLDNCHQQTVSVTMCENISNLNDKIIATEVLIWWLTIIMCGSELEWNFVSKHYIFYYISLKCLYLLSTYLVRIHEHMQYGADNNVNEEMLEVIVEDWLGKPTVWPQ